MPEKSRVPWLRIGAESVAIVSSILLAFAINAWWDNRQQAAAEHAFLQSLLEDLQAKQQRLGNDRLYNNAILEAISGLLDFASDSDSELTEAAIDRLIADTWWYNVEASWDSAPMRALGDGSRVVISNPELIQKLGELQISISRIRNFYKIDENFHHNVFTPFLIEHADLPSVASQTDHMPGRPEILFNYPDSDVLAALASEKHSELVRQKPFQNVLVAKMDRVTDILQNAYRSIDEELENVILMLHDELQE